jgi:hypothetical protein
MDKDKIKINWNKKPIEMNLFLSFLTVPVVRSNDHLGYWNGWTKLTNSESKLVIGGGIVNDTEYLDHIEYGKNLDNPYNNYVNPFYLFDILNDDGKRFFINYYKQDIEKMVADAKYGIEGLVNQLEKRKEELRHTEQQIKQLVDSVTAPTTIK